MELKDKIVNVKPRETSGSRTGKKYDYQTHWSICKVLDLHVSNEDYLIVMEYHDDVVILNSSEQPSKVSFYQLKTAESNIKIPKWKLNTLKNVPKNKKNSILGKLFFNFQNFGDDVEKLCFVSNASFDFDLLDPAHDSSEKLSIKCSELSIQSLNDLKTSLKGEFLLDDDPDLDELLSFEVSELIPNKQEELTRDYISRFIETNFPGRNYTISPIYKALFGQFTRKRNYDKIVTEYNEFIKKKGLSKSDIDEILLVISEQENTFKFLEGKITADFKIEGVSVSGIRKFVSNWRRLEVMMLNIDKSIIELIEGKIKLIIEDLETKEALEDKMIDCQDQVFGIYENAPINQKSIDVNLIKAIIVKILYAN